MAALAEVGEHVVEVGIVDPMGNGKSTIRTTVDRRTDMLELERSHGRISEAARRSRATPARWSAPQRSA